MKHFLIILCCCTAGFGAEAQNTAAHINAWLSRTDIKNRFNGTALVAQNGNILLYKGYGYRNRATGSLNDTGTVYRIGSMTKPITATVILQLAREQQLAITDPLSKYLPGYPNGDAITIEQLLTHSSGIKEYLSIPSIQRLPDGAAPITLDSLIASFSHVPLEKLKGDRFSYSNSNYVLLAAVIEKVTGKKYETVVRERVFQPTQMLSSGFDFKHLDTAGKATGQNTVIDFDSTYAPGCGAAYSTVMDMYHFYMGWVGYSLLDTGTVTSAWTPRHWLYGYGWFVYTQYGKKCISHAGGVPGFRSNIQFYPEDGLCIVLLGNMDNADMVNTSDHIAAFVFRQRFKSSGL